MEIDVEVGIFYASEQDDTRRVILPLFPLTSNGLRELKSRPLGIDAG
jgi:hypothetical protein